MSGTRTSTGEEAACPSCGHPRPEVFCPECGERRLRPDEFSFRRFVAEAASELVGGGGSRLWRSLRLLLTRPGHLTAEYVRGRRRPYLRPLQLFLLANVVYFVVQPYTRATGYNTPLQSQIERQYYSHRMPLDEIVQAEVDERGIPYETYEHLFDLQSSNYARTLVILMVPILAALLAVLLARRRRPFVHHLVFALHYYAWELLFVFSLFVFFWSWLIYGVVVGAAAAGIDLVDIVRDGGLALRLLWHLLTEAITMLLAIPYLYLALRRFYGAGRWGAGLAAIVLWFATQVITLLYRFMLFWITFLTV